MDPDGVGADRCLTEGSFPEFSATQKMKEEVGGNGLYSDGEEGEAGNATPPSRPITALVVCVAATRILVFREVNVRLRCKLDGEA